ncbi:hypothetical protein HDE_14420 [Halotydeus destructor]|nr:hypothetical protein HDE_14420 [Halotydeus destructor]
MLFYKNAKFQTSSNSTDSQPGLNHTTTTKFEVTQMYTIKNQTTTASKTENVLTKLSRMAILMSVVILPLGILGVLFEYRILVLLMAVTTGLIAAHSIYTLYQAGQTIGRSFPTVMTLAISLLSFVYDYMMKKEGGSACNMGW